MTATLVGPAAIENSADPPTASTVDRWSARIILWFTGWPGVVAAASAGTIVIGLAYRLSSRGHPADVYYVVFWAGMLLAVIPVAARMTAVRTPSGGRLAALLLFGVMTAMPKFLRNPTGALYHDEYAHWREAIDVSASGRLFQPNATIPIVEFFPGSSALTATTHTFSGLSLWSAGLLILLIMHVLGLYAVFLIGEALLSSPRAGAVAALVYGINPSAIYFDTQYAYESVAVNFFLWALALTVLATGASSARGRRAFTAAAVMAAAGCVVTHHLTTIFLISVLVVVVSTGLLHAGFTRSDDQSIRSGVRSMGPWWVTLASTVVIAIAWVTVCARPTLDYLSPYLGASVRQLKTMTENSGQGGRELLVANVAPVWERCLTAAAPAVLFVCFLAAAALIRPRRIALDPQAWGLMAFGCAYFLSLPFILAPSGAEGARRSWGFTYLGVALVVALLVVHWPAGRLRWSGRSLSSPLAIALFVTLLIGNVGGGLNDPYRFPGVFRWGTDTNSVSAEARSIAEELGATVGRARVVADAYTALQLTAYGGLVVAAPSEGFPAWNLTQRNEDPSPELARMLVSSGYDYLVVDVRMGEEAPFNGHNFGQGDPLLGRITPMEYLSRLDHVPWAWRVLSTEHLRVYRLDLAAIAARTE
jgi:hypothetical protein